MPEASQPAQRDLKRLPGQRGNGERTVVSLSWAPSGRSAVVQDQCEQRHGREWCQRQLPALNVVTENASADTRLKSDCHGWHRSEQSRLKTLRSEGVNNSKRKKKKRK